MTMFNDSVRAFLKPIVRFLDDDAVTEILINGPQEIWVERAGRLMKTDATFSEEGLLGAVRNVAQFIGRTLNEERPRLDARLPDGSRIHVILPPVARNGTTVTIRKFFKERLTIDALLAFGTLSQPMARFLEAVIVGKLNAMVSGGTGSGKTTLLNIATSLVPSDERIVTIEDSAELKLSQEHVVSLEGRPPDKHGKGEVTLGELLQSALRLRPDRIIVGEVRSGEAFYLMQAMNTGHGGSLATVHANTPADTLRRIESLCLMSSIEMPLIAIRASVASAVNVVVVCERLHSGERKITSIAEVLPLDDKGDYRTRDLFVYCPVGRDAFGHTVGYHAPTGALPSFLEKMKALGFSDIDEKFFDPATYGLPPPPLVAAGSVTTRWAPSLSHRTRGEKDPEAMAKAFAAFEERLIAEANAHARPDVVELKSAAAPARSEAPSPKPKTPAPTPAAPAKLRPAVRVSQDDVTPPPTRNPLAKNKTPAPGSAAAPPRPAAQLTENTAITEAPSSTVDETPSVELSESLLQDIADVPTGRRAIPNLPAKPAPKR